MYLALVTVAMMATVGAVPTARWPIAFVANFSESNGNVSDRGYFALDLRVNNGTAFIGAEAVHRADGSNNRCGMFHKETPCTELATGGLRLNSPFRTVSLATTKSKSWVPRCCAWGLTCADGAFGAGQRYFIFPELHKCCVCCSWASI